MGEDVLAGLLRDVIDRMGAIETNIVVVQGELRALTEQVRTANGRTGKLEEWKAMRERSLRDAEKLQEGRDQVRREDISRIKAIKAFVLGDVRVVVPVVVIIALLAGDIIIGRFRP